MFLVCSRCVPAVFQVSLVSLCSPSRVPVGGDNSWGWFGGDHRAGAVLGQAGDGGHLPAGVGSPPKCSRTAKYSQIFQDKKYSRTKSLLNLTTLKSQNNQIFQSSQIFQLSSFVLFFFFFFHILSGKDVLGRPEKHQSIHGK